MIRPAVRNAPPRPVELHARVTWQLVIVGILASVVATPRCLAQPALELARAPNRIPAEALLAGPPASLLLPAADGTVLVGADAIVYYDLAGAERARVPLARGDVAARVLTTIDASGFAPARALAVAEVTIDPPSRSQLMVLDAAGQSAARFTIAVRENLAVSPEGRYFVAWGRAQGVPALGVELAPPLGELEVYDRSGRRLSELGSTENPYWFGDVHDRGVVAALRGDPGEARVVLLEVDGTPSWEQPFASAPDEMLRLVLTPRGDYLVSVRSAGEEGGMRHEARVHETARGAVRFEHATASPLSVHPCGGALVVLREQRAREEHLLTVADAAAGAVLGTFTIPLAIQDVTARASEDGSTLYLALIHRDDAGRHLLRLEARAPNGRLLAERDLGDAPPAAGPLLLRDYGDGAHWLVPAAGALWLFAP